MEFLLPFLYVVLFLVLLYNYPFFKIQSLNKHLLPAFFLIKILTAIGLVLIYTYYYTDRKTADIFKFFDDSILLHNVSKINFSDYIKLFFGIDASNETLLLHTKQMQFWNNSNPNELYNDSRIMIKLNSLIHFISFGYYGVHLVFFTFLSFVGLVAFYKAFAHFFEQKGMLLVMVFLFPSLLLWTSGILKESILFLALGFVLYSFFELIHQKSSFKNVLLFIFSFLILVVIKPYVLLFLLPAICCYFVTYKFKLKHIYLFYLGFYAFFIATALSLKFINPNYDALNVIATKQNNFINMATGGVYLHDGKKEVHIADENRSFLIQLSDTSCKIKPNSSYSYRLSGNNKFIDVAKSIPDETIYSITFDAPTSGSLLPVKRLEPTITAFLIALPMALINVLFMPFLFSSFHPFMLMSGIENFILLLLLVGSVIFRKKRALINHHLLLFCFATAIGILLFVGLTTPVLGAMVRYKIPGLLLFFMGFLCVLDIEKIVTLLKKLLRNKHFIF